VFVARERELQRLDEFLQAALEGQGRVVFVTGGPGRGKTALVGEFARRAMEAQPDLLVASGGCNAYSGVGDPYLPFREVMAMLTADVEARWAAGAITRGHARRLWAALPLVVRMLLDHGPHLVDVFFSGAALLSRATSAAQNGAPWLEPLRAYAERQRASSTGLEQSHIFQQVTNVLRALAEEHPLLLILDDVQWVDSASTGLLFHLGRRLEGSRVLIACAYRPEEVALGRPLTSSRQWERHPLEKALGEFKRQFGDVWVDLGQAQEAEGRRFVDAWLETEPNRLDEAFQDALFRHTGGHPLFTVELLRAMQERGDLIQDEDGQWVLGAALDWETLPARVEGVIEERVGRLEEELREILTVASVEGEEFTAQVVARVGEIGERQLLRALSQELEKRHRLVREQGELAVARQRLSRYRFAHALFQGYLYNSLGEGERRLLHQEIGAVLEELYAGAGRTEEIAAQLARHYAGDAAKERHYAKLAGERAAAAFANDEALRHLSRALELTPETDNVARFTLLLAREKVY
ncbi:MAG: AAA family ATPase, partial [Delftia sp.]|nr:AAA family ATPase [Delftia sp.]